MDKIIIHDGFDMNFNTPLAILDDVSNVKITEKLNAEYDLEFSVAKSDKNIYVINNNYVEVVGEIFKITSVERERNKSQINFAVKAEHIFYEMLDDYVEEAKSYYATPNQIIEKIQAYTDFNLIVDPLIADYPKKNCTISRGSPIKSLNRVLDKWNLEILRNRRNVTITPMINYKELQLFKNKKNISSLRRIDTDKDITTRLYLIGREGLDILGLPVDLVPHRSETQGEITKFFNNNDSMLFSARTILKDGKLVFNSKFIDSKYIYDYPTIKNNEVLNSEIEEPIDLLLYGIDELKKIESTKETYELNVDELKHTFGDLERFGLGTTVLIQDEDILDDKNNNIIQARIIEYTHYPLEPEKNSTVKVGVYGVDILDFFGDLNDIKGIVDENSNRWDKIEDMIDKDGNISTDWLNDRIAKSGDEIRLGSGHIVMNDTGLMVMDTTDINTAKAIVIITTSIDLQTGKLKPIMGLAHRENTSIPFEYRTALDSYGIHADVIRTGLLQGGKVKFNLSQGTLLIGNSTEDYELYFDGDKLFLKGLDLMIENGDLLEKVRTHFIFDENGMTIGKSNSPLKIGISNEQINFIDGAKTVAYINGQKMYIEELEVLDSIIIGNHRIEKLDEEITVVRWLKK